MGFSIGAGALSWTVLAGSPVLDGAADGASCCIPAERALEPPKSPPLFICIPGGRPPCTGDAVAGCGLFSCTGRCIACALSCGAGPCVALGAGCCTVDFCCTGCVLLPAPLSCSLLKMGFSVLGPRPPPSSLSSPNCDSSIIVSSTNRRLLRLAL